jgi:TRAP-type C4-dicarboxylate transport system substrate-binding protein
MRPSTGTRALTAALAVACVVGLTACDDVVTKAGAPASGSLRATVIHLGAVDAGNPELASFVSNVAAMSRHRLRIDVDRRTYFSETPGGEAKLPGALKAGEVELGYLPARDWAQAGAPGFAALQAPGLLTTTAQEIRLARDPIAAELLGGLRSKGVVGLDLIPDEARRLITVRPLLEAADLAGARIRVSDNARTAAMIQHLGGRAVQGLTAGQTKKSLLQGRLDGVETGPTPASQNSYNDPAPYLTSFGLLPKFEVLAASAAFWKRLPPADRRLVRAAATRTLDRSATEVPAREASRLRLVCLNGAVIVRPQPAALRRLLALAQQARPTDAADRTLMSRIAAAARADGTPTDAAAVPTQCRVATSANAAEQAHHAGIESVAPTRSANPAQLVGTYRIDVTEQDWIDGGVVGPDFSTAVTFTWTLSGDGTMYESQQPDFPDQGPLRGTWRVYGDRIIFISHGDTGDEFDEIVTWSYFKGVLTLKAIRVQDQPGAVLYSLPWRKTA